MAAGGGDKAAAISAEEQFELSPFLTDAEMAAMVEPTRLKLDTFVKKAKAAVEILRVARDQQCFELERQFQETSQVLSASQKTVAELTAAKKALEGNVKSYAAKLDDSHQNAASAQKQLEETKHQNEMLSAEKQDLLTMLDKRIHEAESLHDESKSMSSQLATVTADKFKALARVDELTSEDAILRQHVSRLEQEKESLMKQVGHLNVEQSRTSQRLYSMRSEQGHKVVELQAKLDDVAEQLRQTISVKESMQKVIDDQNRKLEEQSVQAKELKDSRISCEEQFQHQLQVYSKLVALYKSSNETQREKAMKLTTAVEEMQSLMRRADAAHHERELELERERNARLEMAAEKDGTIATLRSDLARVERLLEQTHKQVLSEEELSRLAPSAAAASRLLRSGKSLSEIYVEYMCAVDQLQETKEENAQLSAYLEQILEEIEVKAPVLVRQREDYEKALETVAQLSGRLNQSVSSHEKLNSELADVRCKFFACQQGRDRLDGTVADLRHQVCVLLREIEMTKGHFVDDQDDQNHVGAGSLTAQATITKNLVTFKDVEELQAQNQNLLVVVRELSEEHERKSHEKEEQKLSEIRKELKYALNEVEQLRAARDSQKEVVDAIVRQRDMYRALLSQANQNLLHDGDSSGSPQMTPSTPKTSGAVPSISVEEHETLKASLGQLQDELAHHKTLSQDNAKVYEEQSEQLKSERLELRLLSAKLTAKLEFVEERHSMARTSADGYKKDVSALVDRNRQLSGIVARHEESVSLLRTELMQCQEKLAKSDVALENLRLEHSLVRQAEARLKVENEILRREKYGQGMLMANLEAIQTALEKSDVESRLQWQGRVSLLEKELAATRNRADCEAECTRAALDALRKEKQDVFDKLNEEVEAHRKTRDDLVNSYGTLHESRQAVLAAEEKLRALESTALREDRPRPVKLARQAGVGGGSDQQHDRDDEAAVALVDARAEVKNLRSQLEQSRTYRSQFESMVTSLEGQLKEQHELTAQLKVNSNESLKEKLDEIARLGELMDRLKKENESLAAKNTERSASDGTQVGGLQQELASVRQELHVALRAVEDGRQNERVMRDDLRERSAALEEVKINYQRELMLHASDVQELEKLRTEFQGHESKIAAARETADRAEYGLKTGRESWQSREAILTDQLSRSTSRCEELERRNQLLHDQMEKMSDQMTGVQAKKASFAAGEDDTVASGSLDAGSGEQLLELIKYLRRERDIATTKAEMCSAESQQLASKVEFVEARLDEANRSLAEVQRKDEADLFTSAQHAELLRKVELLTVLTDGNRILRLEKTEIESRLTAAEGGLAKLEAEVSPLREQNRELGARCESLLAERRALEGEARRWQARTQQLTGMRSEKESVQSDLKVAQDSVARMTKELTSSKSQVEELNRTAMQVRKIGRKYKAQYDEVKAQYDELQVKHRDLEEARAAIEKAAAESAAAAAAAATAAAAAAAASKPDPVPVVNLAEAVSAAKQEVRQEMESMVKESEDKVKASEEKLKKLRQNAYQRIMTLTGERDKHLKEVDTLKAKLMAIEQAQQSDNDQASQARSTLESQVKELELSVEESRAASWLAVQEKQTLQKEVDALVAKVGAQQKQIETLQARLKENASIKLAAVASTSRESSILSQTGPDVTTTPPTANIKPMATMPSSTPVRHAHPVNQAARQMPMGRIRPITPFSQSSTRMAAVTPTTAASSQQQQQHEVSEVESTVGVITASSGSCVPQATVAPTPAVHAVAALSSTLLSSIEASSTQQQQQHHQHQVTATCAEVTSSQVEEPDVDVTSNEAPQDLSVAGTTTTTTTTTADHAAASSTPPAPLIDDDLGSVATSEVIPAGTSTSENLLPKVVVKRLRLEPEDARAVVASAKEDDRPAIKRSKSGFSEPDGSLSNAAVGLATGTDDLQCRSVQIEANPVASANSGTLSMESSQSKAIQPVDADSELEVILVESDEDDDEDGGSKQGEDDDHEDVDVYEGVDEVDVEVEENLSADETVEDDADVGGSGAGGIGTDDVKQMEVQEGEVAGADDYADDEITEEFQDDDGVKMDEQFENVTDEMVDDDIEIIEQEENVDVDEEEEVVERSMEADASQPVQAMDDCSESGNSEITSSVPMEQQQQIVAPIQQPGQQQQQQQQQPIIAQPLGMPISRHSVQVGARMTANQRLPTLSRTQQPTPFPTMGANTSGGFEDGDSIVPSTPTLFDPRKNDGFAEAVSSPQVPPERFLFGSSSSETPSQLASQGALGVDDTRMDLGQLEESSGRSVPSTPLQVSPPDTLQEISAFGSSGGNVAAEDAVPSLTIQDITSGESETSGEPLFASGDDGAIGTVSFVVEEPPETPTEQVVVADPVIVEVSCDVAAELETATSSAAAAATATTAATVPAVSTSAESSVATPRQSARGSYARPASNRRDSQMFHNQRRATPIVWDQPMMGGEGGGGGGGGGGGPGGPGPRMQQQQHHAMPFGRNEGGHHRPYTRRLRVMGHPVHMRMGRPFQRGGGGGNRGQRYPRMNR